MKNKIFWVVLYIAFSIYSSLGCKTKIPSTTKQMNTDSNTIKIKIEKTRFIEMNILFISDTAFSTPAIKNILGKGYGEIMQVVQQKQLQPLKFIAWYYSTQAPWKMDIAVEVNKIPENISGRTTSRIQPGGEVLIAHIWGPYDQVGQAYTAVENWLKENKRKAKGAPFEVYINDPATVNNPSEIQTDIYQPLE